MRRRGCLISFGALAALVLICCLVVWFVALPQFQSSISESLGDELSTQVASQVARTGATIAPDTYTISTDELEQQLRQSGGMDNVNDIALSADNGMLTLSFGNSGQTFEYTGDPVAVDGRLELANVESTGPGWFDQIFPPDTLADALESGVNSYFDAQGLDITEVAADNNELVVTTVDENA